MVNMVAKRAIGSYYYSTTRDVPDAGRQEPQGLEGQGLGPEQRRTRKALPPTSSASDEDAGREDGGRRKAE